ncbi:hypothetical protein CDL15_Pgr011473 [Punica granatum]|uniref:Uncharacterized protein n=1 Tax=Punica granatum TaxID=22663 RepID=A0A218WES4_PUNGR|nr:hypothetical protein CDL15_Pgr011473 [Punica granatum]
MYAAHPHHHHHHHLEIPDQIAGEEDAASVSPAGDSLDDSRIHYEHHPALLTGGSAIDEVPPEAAYVSGDGTDLAVPGHEDDSSQLTLSFQGQVYVFDAVTPKKVHAVLLLLGGYELSSGSQGVDMSLQTHRGVVDLPSRCSQPQRVASLNRFRQKRKERCFDRKVRYSVRQEVALRLVKKLPCLNSLVNLVQLYALWHKFKVYTDDAAGPIWTEGTLRDLTKRPPDHALTSVEQVSYSALMDKFYSPCTSSLDTLPLVDL